MAFDHQVTTAETASARVAGKIKIAKWFWRRGGENLGFISDESTLSAYQSGVFFMLQAFAIFLTECVELPELAGAA